MKSFSDTITVTNQSKSFLQSLPTAKLTFVDSQYSQISPTISLRPLCPH